MSIFDSEMTSDDVELAVEAKITNWLSDDKNIYMYHESGLPVHPIYEIHDRKVFFIPGFHIVLYKNIPDFFTIERVDYISLNAVCTSTAGLPEYIKRLTINSYESEIDISHTKRCDKICIYSYKGNVIDLRYTKANEVHISDVDCEKIIFGPDTKRSTIKTCSRLEYIYNCDINCDIFISDCPDLKNVGMNVPAYDVKFYKIFKNNGIVDILSSNRLYDVENCILSLNNANNKRRGICQFLVRNH